MENCYSSLDRTSYAKENTYLSNVNLKSFNKKMSMELYMNENRGNFGEIVESVGKNGVDDDMILDDIKKLKDF